MSDTVISVENLSKKYLLTHLADKREQLFSSLLANKIKNVGSRMAGAFKRGPAQEQTVEDFWALKDVSFEIKQGDRVGIIGRNGAGKSTLLKILSRITEPTKGRITIDGRIASLLEVGTGFHSELSGRENIYLNGAILGMSREEIKRKFDEIVDFAEVGKFLDTPVKRYSSGMYVRLAFSVAAHLEPEILIVDEVLAVGDAQFQKKCLGKMEDVSKKEGRTVLFVSHNMAAISSLCLKSICLDSGKVLKIGTTKEVLPLYFGSGNATNSKGVEIKTYLVDNNDGWFKGTKIAVEISWKPYRFHPGWECDIAGYTMEGIKMFVAQSQHIDGFTSESSEANCLTFFIENVGFTDKPLRLDVGIRDKAGMPYSVLVENCALLLPDTTNLSGYKRDEVLIIPNIECAVTKK